MGKWALALLVALVGAACGGNDSSTGEGPPPATLASAPDAGSGSSSGDSVSFGDASSPPPAAPGKTLLYAHTDTTLFQLDPTNIAAPMTELGTFDCIGQGGAGAMTDLGVTKDGKLYGVSQVAAYPLAVSGKTVHCEATWPLPAGAKFYGLTVAPENTLGASEVLVAANGAGELHRIDANTGNTTLVGTFGNDPVTGEPWALSGDIVFLANNGSPVGFATVRTCPNGKCSTVDTLIEIDVKAIAPGTQSVLKAVRGAVVKGSWCTNTATPASFGSIYGVAAHADKVFGFTRKGQIVEMHNDDGTACLVQAFGSTLFAGAGVTTSAPVVAPAPK